MKSPLHLTGPLFLVLATASLHAAAVETETCRIPFSEIGATAGKQYSGDAIGITSTEHGAVLRAGFQKLEADATDEGLWLRSTEQEGGRFRLTASAIGRDSFPLRLPDKGVVSVGEQVVDFVRPGLTEQYSVSMDGIRQDFVVHERPVGVGDLRLEVNLDGACAESASYGAKLVVDGTGRELAYSRLHVTDASGKDLSASMEVVAARRLLFTVDDSNAAYPVTIDPTFSDADWVSLNPGVLGVDGIVNAITSDGSGNVYVGGSFTVAGTVTANNIAKWDGSAWTALGAGITGGIYGGENAYVYSLAMIGSDLYVGGGFTTAGGTPANSIAKWDGSAWMALGGGVEGLAVNDVKTLAVSGGDLYVGGNFTTAGGVSADRIAKWDGSNWSALGTGMNNNVLALAVTGTELYAGGDFTTAGGVSANRIAKWNGTAWMALGSGTNSTVRALAVYDGELFAGGSFTTAGTVSASRIAKWDGSIWSALGSGIAGGGGRSVKALVASGDGLYVGGIFTSIDGVSANRIAKWDGSNWSGFNTDSDYPGAAINALAVSGGDLYVGGNFGTVGGVAATAIGKWDGNGWSPLGLGFDAGINVVMVNGSELYAGGDFTIAAGVPANHIAKWNGSAWSALGDGADASVHALAMIGNDLFAGGYFSNAGGVEVNHIAKWDGAVWSALGSGMDSFVWALTVSDGDLFAGGSFTTAGGVSANRIAKWDGSAWSSLGSGMNGDVQALTASGANLYAGGSFTSADGVAAMNIAKWDGSLWSGLGLGTNGQIYAMAVDGNSLYAGGTFTTAGGGSSNCIARWDGSTWSSLGSGMDQRVRALAVNGGDIYAGGDFSTAGGVAASHIAKWNGTSWSNLGSGTDVAVLALAADSANHLFLGGSFSMVGTTVSPFIAQANLPEPDVEPTVTSPTFSSVTGSAATLGGNVASDGGAEITTRGVVFAPSATNNNPLLGGAGVTDVTTPGTLGVFTVNAINLIPGTDYTFAAYATNSVGTSYSDTGSFPTLSAPEIAIEQPLNNNIGDDGAKGFGSVSLGDSRSLQFTIRNLGDLPLTGIAVTRDGTEFSEFVVTESPSTSVASNDSTTFTVRFSPTSDGPKTAAIHIASNDIDENPFDINLTGSGAAALAVFQEVIAANSSLIGDDALPDAVPYSDGVSNLEKYAFNMNLSGSDSSTLTPDSGTSGLPTYALDDSGPTTVVRVQYIRRTGSGLVYTPQKSGNLETETFEPMNGTETSETLGGGFERVTVVAPCDPATEPTCFWQVRVTLP